MNQILLHLHPTYAAHIDNKNFEQALASANKVLEATVGDSELTPFQKASELNAGWFQISLILTLQGKLTDAADAAVKSYDFSIWDFEQHPILVEILLAGDQPHYYEKAVEIAEWHFFSLETRHENHSNQKKIKELMEECRDRADAAKWYLEDLRYFELRNEAFNGESSWNSLLDLIDEWRQMGRDPIECDSIEINSLYYMDRDNEIVDKWTHPFSEIKYPFAFANLCIQTILSGNALPDPLPFPPDNNVVKWTEAILGFTVHNLEMYLFKHDLSWTEIREDTAEKYLIPNRLLDFAITCANNLDKLFNDFFNGATNGSAASELAFSHFKVIYGDLLERINLSEDAFYQYYEGVQQASTLELLGRCIDKAFDFSKEDIALSCLLKMQDEYGEEFDWEAQHQNLRLRLWAVGKIETLPEFLKYYDWYHEQYKDFYRLMRGMHVELYNYAPFTLELAGQQFFYANNNKWEVLQDLIENHPDNPDIIWRTFLTRYYQDRSDSYLWCLENLNKINVLEDLANDDQGKINLFITLSSAGYLVAAPSIYFNRKNNSDDNLSLNDEELSLLQQGLELLIKADKLAFSPDFPALTIDSLYVAQNILDQAYIYESLDQFDNALACYERILKPNSHFDNIYFHWNEKYDRPIDSSFTSEKFELFRREFASQDLSEMPTTLFTLANQKTAELKEKLGAPNEDILVLYERVFRMNPLGSKIWYKLATWLNKNNSRPQLQIVLSNYFLVLYDDEPYNTLRLDILAIAAKSMLEIGLIWQAKRCISDLERHAPEYPELQSLIDLAKDKKVTPDQDELDESETRKQRSINKLKEMNIPFLETLPTIPASKYLRKRPVASIIRRAIAVFANIQAAKDRHSGNYGDEDLAFYKEFLSNFGISISDYLTLNEKEMLIGQPSDESIEHALWQYESFWVLCWAVGLVDNLDFPSDTVDSELCRNIISEHPNLEAFSSDIELRDFNEILDEADLIYRYHWAIRNAELNGTEIPANLNPHVVIQRHWALNWLIDADGCNDWSQVDIST